MATWPSSSKASTSNVDSGSDKPRLARGDIKQNIDNTNAIIDMFDISSPNDKDVLAYNSSNARFETQAATFQEAILRVGTAVSNTDPYVDITSIDSDPNGITSLTSGNFTLAAGTYLFWCYTANGASSDALSTRSGTFELVDPDGDTGGGALTVISYNSSPIFDGLVLFDKLVVASGGNTFAIKHNATFAPNVSSGNIPNDTYLRIVKVA